MLLHDDEGMKELLKGAEQMYRTVATTYGPKGRNILIEKTYGRPVLTRDGVSVSREVYSSNRAENMGMQLLMEAANTTNHNAGDGTSATVILTYFLLKYGQQQVAAGVDPMIIREMLRQDSWKLLDALGKISKPVAKGQLTQVATVSCGDTALGELIADAVEQVGHDGGIITEKAPINGIDRKFVNGYYMGQGFNAIQSGKKEVENCYVVVTAKPISSGMDAIQLMNAVGIMAHKEQGLEDIRQPLTQPLRIAFFGEIEGDAYNTIVANIQKGAFDGVIVKSPPVGDMASKYLEDLAIYTGGKLLTSADPLNTFDDSFIGKANKVASTASETTVFGGAGAEEDVAIRVAEIKDRLNIEEVAAIAEKMHDRIAKLEGRIAIFRIGGATDTEREELEFRIEDAIQATKAAAQYGVVPGGGSTLVQLAKTEELSKVFSDALRACFKRLMDNAGLPAEVKLNELEGAEKGFGFNLREGEELVNLIQAGILDPTLVLEEVIKNASSTAGNALTIGCVITFVDSEGE